jgi:DNA integrity scanning protein DisA with diadenylate cyclase activity
VVAERSDDTLRLRATLAEIAPGTALRDGLERILRGRTGALIVLGIDKTVESIATGGFTLDVPFTATGLRELAKMDGAIIVDKDVSRIHLAAVHLMPDHTIPSEETGTRHRTADRVARQIDDYVLELGTDGRLLSLQLEELITGVDAERELVVRDYLPTGKRRKTSTESMLTDLANLSPTDLVDPGSVAGVLGLGTGEHLDGAVAPRGYRLLAKVPRLPSPVVDRLVEHFGGLQQLLSAGIDDLQTVEGVGELRARSVREGLSRLAESSITERYI